VNGIRVRAARKKKGNNGGLTQPGGRQKRSTTERIPAVWICAGIQKPGYCI
jgi:hypothetical protein